MVLVYREITYGARTPFTNPSRGKIKIGLYQIKFILQMRQIMSWSYKYHIKLVRIVIYNKVVVKARSDLQT
jgi:hypothetical protein